MFVISGRKFGRKDWGESRPSRGRKLEDHFRACVEFEGKCGPQSARVFERVGFVKEDHIEFSARRPSRGQVSLVCFFRLERPLVIALLVAGPFFMENLDGTVIATAMPQMARSFGASPVDLNIGMTAYLQALAVFIPISGWLADLFGARPVFGGAIGLFTASSVLCGLSNGLWEFTAARILQGLGGAMPDFHSTRLVQRFVEVHLTRRPTPPELSCKNLLRERGTTGAPTPRA